MAAGAPLFGWDEGTNISRLALDGRTVSVAELQTGAVLKEEVDASNPGDGVAPDQGGAVDADEIVSGELGLYGRQ